MPYSVALIPRSGLGSTIYSQHDAGNEGSLVRKQERFVDGRSTGPPRQDVMKSSA